MTPMSKLLTACVMSLMIGGEFAAPAATLPQLPQKQVDVTMPTVTGNTYSVTSCGTLKSTLNTAAAADPTKTHAVDILASLTCTGPYTLPARVGATGWVLVRSASYASLPAEGTRVTTSDVSNMPQITYGESQGYYGAIAVQTGAQRYRLIGISMVQDSVITENQVLFEMGYGNARKTNTGYFIVDRCALRDTDASHQTVRAIYGDAQLGNTAILDSYISGIKHASRDSQAWLSITNAGPILIKNNFLEAAGENVMFCGGMPANINVNQQYMPKDITVQHNTMSKPAFWGTTSGWVMKTLFETKCGLRILLEGNIFENMAGHQGDYAFRLTPRNEYVNPSYIEVSDVTVRYNLIRNVVNWINSGGSDDGDVYPGTFPTSGSYSNHSKRWAFHDNLVYGLGYQPFGGGHYGALYSIGAGGGLTKCYDVTTTCMNEDISFVHNTIDGIPEREIYASNGGLKNLDFRDNLINDGGGYGMYGIDYANVWGTKMLNQVWGATWSWTCNTITGLGGIGRPSSEYPQGNGNSYPLSDTSILWTDPTNPNRDYTLQAGSPAKNTASDGTDRGVNFSAYNAAQAGGSSDAGPTPPAIP